MSPCLVLNKNREDNFNNKQRRDKPGEYGNLSAPAGDGFKYNITRYAPHDTVGDRVGERHDNKGKEGGDRFGVILKIDILYRGEHEEPDEDQHWCCSSSRNYRKDGREEEGEEEKESGDHGGKTGAAAFCYPRG